MLASQQKFSTKAYYTPKNSLNKTTFDFTNLNSIKSRKSTSSTHSKYSSSSVLTRSKVFDVLSRKNKRN